MKENLECTLKAFPKYCAYDVEKVAELIGYNHSTVNSIKRIVKIQSDDIYIPSRVYNNELHEDAIKHLTNNQLKILYCYYSRHHDGYLRQRCLKRLFEMGELEEWVIPYVILLCGEYVAEILEDVYDNWGSIDDELLINFVNENPKLITLTEGRIASYYGEFYMALYNKRDYVGFKIKKELQKYRNANSKRRG